MKQSLQLKLGQQLTMTPQLQQAIRLLQLSTLDLQQEIQDALDSNPMLEVTEEEGNEGGDSQKNTETSEEYQARDEASPDLSEKDLNSSDWESDIPNDLPVDTSWDEIYQPTSTPNSSGSGENDDFDFESRRSSTESLFDHLMWQLNLTPMSDQDRVIAMAIVDAVGPNGILTSNINDIYSGLIESIEDLELDEVEAVLHRVQQFDPPGVAAHDLQECLLIQLRQLPSDTPYLKEAMTVVRDHLTLLGSRDYKQLMRKTKLKEPELRDTILLIQQLNPRPGDLINSGDTEYVVPDVFVSKEEDRWAVRLNPEIAPKIRINPEYASLIKRADSSSDNTFLRDNLQEARWFLKSLQSRNETLLRVASCIVEKQRGFLDYGAEAMKPLVLHDVAEAVGMHESTISRVTTQKYMHTPQGIFELKYFFSSHVSTDTGGECSSTAIRAIIKKLIVAENPRKPLSDSKIAELLAEQGIQVARRTIAKYRESLSIPPSNERKRLV
ncbi:RNA polymerase factor sigma-54 [Gilvimarinus sp. F26214L]|uniref:RNA polymerase factor sigma-54 n=1 Tax=Gilvimarinus sp. DZF01 TaxID=3461371 RepID=UPI0040465F7F